MNTIDIEEYHTHGSADPCIGCHVEDLREINADLLAALEALYRCAVEHWDPDGEDMDAADAAINDAGGHTAKRGELQST